MRLFGLEIKRAEKRGYVTDGPNTWMNIFSSVNEPYTGAWQSGIRYDRSSLLAFSAVYCCVTGIASDIAKLRIKLCEENDGIWNEVMDGSKYPWLSVLRKPNHYQTRLKFLEQWILSKLLHGNAYIAKERDGRGVVSALYVLDPCRVKALIADNGEVFYEIQQDSLSQIEENLIAPASEIIHDAMPGLFHPLCGTSPLYACAMSTQLGNNIQTNSTKFFENQSRPGGMLSAPGRIAQETADRLKATFESNFGGTNIGKLFVGGDGLTFQPFTMTAEQSELVEQLKWSVGDVARAFHYPEYKLGGPLPPYSGNMQALTLSYYTDCLQTLIEAVEISLDEGLDLPADVGTELDTDNLLRMDTASLYEANNKAVGGGWMAPDEARLRANLAKVKGGDTPYLQQQNYSLAALAKRDSQADPFGTKQSKPEGVSALPPVPVPPPPAREAEIIDTEIAIAVVQRELTR